MEGIYLSEYFFNLALIIAINLTLLFFLVFKWKKRSAKGFLTLEEGITTVFISLITIPFLIWALLDIPNVVSDK